MPRDPPVIRATFESSDSFMVFESISGNRDGSHFVFFNHGATGQRKKGTAKGRPEKYVLAIEKLF
jgi:hypothetical protein